MHHVTVRQDEAVRREDKAGAIAAHLLTTARISRPMMSRLVVDFDVDDRGADLFRGGDHRSRIGIQNLVIGRGRLREADLLGRHTVPCHQSENLLHDTPTSMRTELTSTGSYNSS